ncbi:hypothetical protein ZTR_06218 [Talaromyces verruculosus]|nr:hypothetical protein ZTR_06218 [Talaromyces verruculosus]
MAIDSNVLELTFNHVAFPPKLPGKRDSKIEDVDRDLLTRLRTAVSTIKNYADNEFTSTWDDIDESLAICQPLNESSFINRQALESALQSIKPNHTIILHVTKQNAGLIIRSSGGRVFTQREFGNPTFQKNLGIFLENASLEALDDFSAKTRKAGVSIAENRDTVHPALITDFLVTLLEVNGARANPPLLRKRVKDDVCWDNAELSWRRNPFWLILRVAVQRLLYFTLGEEKGRAQYKTLLCILLSQLLTDCVHASFSPELCNFLRAKLCRRLAKLEGEKLLASPSASPTYSRLSRDIHPICSDAIDRTTKFIETGWQAFKTHSIRKIPTLPLQAYRSDLHLTLPNSMPYLRKIFKQDHLTVSQRRVAIDYSFLDPVTRKTNSQHHTALLKRYCELQDLETKFEGVADDVLSISQADSESKCTETANKICGYINAVGDAYKGDGEQMSIFMLNVFELWVLMDKCAVRMNPLIPQYHPVFEPKMLDVLLLTRLHDMRRLQSIQKYLYSRCVNANSALDIFADPQEGCFADRYFQHGESDSVQRLKDLEAGIESASTAAREDKEREMKQVNAAYNDRTENIMQTACTQRITAEGKHDIRGCTHCWHVRSRRRLEISVHEDFLHDKDVVQRRCTLFELDIPQAFSAYRKATWEILLFLIPAIQSKSSAPEKTLKDYSQLASYYHRPSSFSLASTTKSFLGTHYKWRSLPIALKKVLLPLGLRFAYYDSEREIWTKDIKRPLSFAHHFVLSIPRGLSLSNLYSSPEFAADSNGPSSYEIVASASKCPSDLTVHEFTAHQSLMAGRTRRWYSLLTELGLSNVNFSLQNTMILFHHLALQAGSMLQRDDLRVIHAAFRDFAFCRKLLDQIAQHVEAISQNWRENYYMETMLTLTIRLCTLGHEAVLPDARALLLRIRNITLKWTENLRHETRSAQDHDIAKRSARYGFLAALLCRRTFYLLAYDGAALDKESLTAFTKATLAMQENLVIDVSEFSPATSSILIRDIKMAHRLSSRIRSTFRLFPSSLQPAIDRFWPFSTTEARQYSAWQVYDSPYDEWVTSKIVATGSTVSQVVHYHLLDGHLLIDGRALGKLPAAIRDSDIVKELFGNQQLVAFPSNLPGMEYVLGIQQNYYEIHLGHRGQDIVVQALKRGEHLELVPARIFENGFSFDLPRSLVHNCVHWVDLRSRILEVRRKPKIWHSTPSNWVIDLNISQARRKNSYLVNPRSRTFALVAQLFQNFVPAPMLTVYQPLGKGLSVEIKSMDLIFEMDRRRRLLTCQQLASEVDPDQDAGTFYGLRSMIVLRDTVNPSQRSILTPLGAPKWQKSGIHVKICIENTSRYAKYSIDSVLGRIHCPPEPELLYTKAQLHALTSFVIPDPLTNRNGTEEALRQIADLTPKRHYYPKELMKQQKVSWSAFLTTTIQHDGYQSIVDTIMRKSQRLELFQLQSGTTEIEGTESASKFLSDRAYWRRSIYERPEASPNLPSSIGDFAYKTRGKWTQSERSAKTREIVTLLRDNPDSIHTTDRLKQIMRGWSFIGGYDNVFIPHSINDCLAVDLAQEWGGIVRYCRDASRQSYDVMFLLGLMSFSDGADMRILRTLTAFSVLQDLRTLDLPDVTSLCGSNMDQKPSSEELIRIIRPFCEEYQKPKPPRRRKNKDLSQWYSEQEQKYEQECLEETTSLAQHLLDQWPVWEPSVDEFDEDHLDIDDDALDAIDSYWQPLFDALLFCQHISEIQTILNQHDAYRNGNADEPLVIETIAEVLQSQKRQNTVIPHLSQLLEYKQGKKFNNPQTDVATEDSAKDKLGMDQNSAVSIDGRDPQPVLQAEIKELEALITRHFLRSDDYVRSTYGHHMVRSINAFKIIQQRMGSEPLRSMNQLTMTGNPGNMNLYSEKLSARDMAGLHIGRLRKPALQDVRRYWLSRANLWPSASPTSILELLRSHSSVKLQSDTKKELVGYAKAIAKLQYLCRIEDAILKRDQKRLKSEQENPGYGSWDPVTYPDWVLLEIDANIHIREVQVTVALEMISPTSGSNSVLQMNMGQGKTSVIMPMVACVLADRSMLTRLLVPNALLSQTAQILQSRLGGLLGREITHIPFSRRTPTTENHIREYGKLHEEMGNSGGIILAIPEHVLSFKLCGLQRVSDKKISEAKQMVAIQGWMDRNCRDILDECDFTLATKTQLVYPSGTLLNVDGHPDRWKVTESILDLVAHHVRDLAQLYPQSIDVIDHRTAILSLREYTQEEQRVVREFISMEDVKSNTTRILSKVFSDAPAARKKIYLLRGLFVHGILLLCLKKRWNVQYGLHPGRDPVAVPFHAKGVPSEQAEWGHPDVAIVFTCLAFYYQGLNQEQIRQSLQMVLKSDDPATEYDQWTQTSVSLPEALRHWNIINMDDEGQVAEIWRHLRFSTVVINHFLNHFVFPAHAKQFSIKLQASGWDVPLFSLDSNIASKGMKRPGITTGFSGTNDNRVLLPLTIKQQDLPGLSHTNAEVLTYLLQWRNRDYQLAVNAFGKRFSELELLVHLKERGIRILIDAGAFILEMDNRTLVKEWLDKDHEAKAAVYFGADNKAWVHYRTGKRASLLSTPFADNLEGCIVYLDEAHTRGTDLLLPVEAKGALTLGPNQTKDHTVQAAMRLRQLGTTQSVTYIVPPEVHQNIQDVCNKRPGDWFDSSDVVTWLLHQTCNNIEDLQPLYFSQGRDFCNRIQAAKTYEGSLTSSDHRKAFMAVLQQPELQDLEDLYSAKAPQPDVQSGNLALTGKLLDFQQDLRKRRLASRNAMNSIKSSALEEVEQEREVAFQVEEEREVQRPRRMPARQYPGLHEAIRNFVSTGVLSGEEGFTNAASVFEKTKVRRKYEIDASQLLNCLYVSREFLYTVELKKKMFSDNFTRPVNWVLWSEASQVAMVIIPEEAEAVIPMLRRAKKKMLHFDTLTYYALPGLPSGWTSPSWLAFELGILAGRLYFNYSDYDLLLEYIGVVENNESDSQGSSSSDAQAHSKNTLAFLNEWLATRRQGQDITHTPMGYVCQGRKLRSDHPFFMQRSTGVTEIPQGFTTKYQNAVEDDHEDELSDVEEEVKGSINDLLERDQDENADGEEDYLDYDDERSTGESLDEDEYDDEDEDPVEEGDSEEEEEGENIYSDTDGEYAAEEEEEEEEEEGEDNSVSMNTTSSISIIV